jgi:hypothetical protein
MAAAVAACSTMLYTWIRFKIPLNPVDGAAPVEGDIIRGAVDLLRTWGDQQIAREQRALQEAQDRH